MQKSIAPFCLVALCLLSSCEVKHPAPAGSQAEIPAPVGPLVREPDQFHQRILDPYHILLDAHPALSTIAPFNPSFIASAGIDAIDENFYADHDNKWIAADVREPALKATLRYQYTFNPSGFCDSEVYRFDSGGIATKIYYDAAGRPTKLERTHFRCDHPSDCDSAFGSSVTYHYDERGRITKVAFASNGVAELGGSLEFRYDDRRGLVLALRQDVPGDYTSIDVYEAPGALDSATRNRIGEMLFAAYLPVPKTKLDMISFFETDGYSRVNHYYQMRDSVAEKFGQRVWNPKGHEVAVIGEFENTTRLYNEDGDLTFEMTARPSARMDIVDQMITTRYLYDEDGLLMQKQEWNEFFTRRAEPSLDLTFFHVHKRETK